MAGILKPISGEVWIDGINSKKVKLGQIGKKIGYLFQNPERQIFAPTVKEEVAFGLDLKGYSEEEIEKKIENVLQLFQLSHLRDRCPFYLSHGEKGRVALAGIFMNELSYLILDEPTTGLDRERKKILSEIIGDLQKKGVGMTVISHDFSFVKKHADRIIKISRGEIIEDSKATSRS
jgi:energy-coupling factor transport system ATP-binding protein